MRDNSTWKLSLSRGVWIMKQDVIVNKRREVLVTSVTSTQFDVYQKEFQ